VLLVDRSHFPSDVGSSTHLVWQAGAASLDRWGLLDQVAASGCPPLSTITADLGPVVLVGCPPPVDEVAHAYSPRRLVLDQILVEAATAAGAELREGCTIEELTVDGGRVTGVVGRTTAGTRFTEAAKVVVGADGTHSRVARLVEAPERDPKPQLLGTWFSYWADVPVEGVTFSLRDYRLVYAWGTNAGQTLVGVDWAARDFPSGRDGAGQAFFAELEAIDPELCAHVRAGRRESPWIGGPPLPNIVRKPYGPGWALVGDAGYLKDFGTAQGITDAFRDAELLADALHDAWDGVRPLEEALAGYERRRDEAAMPMYEFTAQFASLEPPPPEMQSLFAALADDPEQRDRFFGVFAGSVGVADFFSPENIGRIMASVG
jgi:2-polyprenyl-6-methoxyphenol hydroxylase-like FAD-dependent oxidoreductase